MLVCLLRCQLTAGGMELIMIKKHTRILHFLLAAALVCLFSVYGQDTVCAAENSEETETHIVTDYLGREVELPVNLSRVVVMDNYNMECVDVFDAIDTVIAVDAWISNDKVGWGRVFEGDEVIANENDEINYEAVIDLNAEVLITSELYSWEQDIEQLEPFGIKVVVCKAYDTENFFDNMTLYGEIFNKPERAQEIIDFIKGNLDYVDEQLADVPKKSLYFEVNSPGRTTIPGDSYFNMVEYSHADNVFKESDVKDIDLEAVIVANPDYMVKIVYPSSGWVVYEPPADETFTEVKEELLSRPGWDEISAVKQDNILLLSQYAHRGATKIVGSFFIAKFLYPEELPDLHPEEIFAKWLGYRGVDHIDGHTRPMFSMED